MDGERFDALTKLFVAGATRRRVLRGLAGSVAGAAAAALGRGAEAAPNACAQQCAFEPKGPRQAACKQACKKCGGSTQDVCFGPTIICCPGSFGECCFDPATGGQVCPGQQQCPPPTVPGEGCSCVCPNTCPPGEFPDPGQDCACVPFPTCDPAGAPENCEAGVFTNCDPEGFCACVENVDGGFSCIERVCGEPCTTGAECAFGACVNVPGCCPDQTFCGFPCGAGVGGASATGWG